MDLDYQNMKKKAMKDLQEFTPSQIAKLKKEYEPLRGKSITVSNSNKLRKMLQRMPKDNLKKLANANIPFLSSGAATQLVMKHGMKFTDFPKTSLFGEEMGELQQEACWTGYKQVGMKKKKGKSVPNCVPEETNLEKLKKTWAIHKFKKGGGEIEKQPEGDAYNAMKWRGKTHSTRDEDQENERARNVMAYRKVLRARKKAKKKK